MDGSDDMYPQALASCVWVFPAWVSGQARAIPVKLQFWEQDVAPPTIMPISTPPPGSADLASTYAPGHQRPHRRPQRAGQLPGGDQPVLDGTMGDGATVEFVCQRVPTLPGISCTATPASSSAPRAEVVTASCTRAGAQYKFCVSSDGGTTWTDLAPYQKAETWTWKPAAGEYLVRAKATVGAAGESTSQAVRYTVQ